LSSHGRVVGGGVGAGGGVVGGTRVGAGVGHASSAHVVPDPKNCPSHIIFFATSTQPSAVQHAPGHLSSLATMANVQLPLAGSHTGTVHGSLSSGQPRV